MRTDLSIIKQLSVVVILSTFLYSDYTWIGDICQPQGCIGCGPIQMRITNAANEIDQNHEKLEKNIKEKYINDILKPNIKIIDKIQEGITKNIAHIRAMEDQANIDTTELIFLLQKNKELFTLPVRSK